MMNDVVVDDDDFVDVGVGDVQEEMNFHCYQNFKYYHYYYYKYHHKYHRQLSSSSSSL